MLLNRQKLAPLIAELLGTFTLTFIVLSVSKSAIGIPYFVAIAAGLTLALMVMIIGATSGSHINPAVSLGFWSVKKISTLKMILYVIFQFVGAIFAWKLYTYLIGNTIPGIGTKSFDMKIMIAELAGTLIFTFGIAAALFQEFKGGKLAATIGGSLTLGVLVSSVVANGVLNPAVALGIQSWGVEYFIGPLIGGVLGFNLYTLVFAGEPFALKVNKKRKVSESKITINSKSTKNKSTTKKRKK